MLNQRQKQIILKENSNNHYDIFHYRNIGFYIADAQHS